ncbi:MAG: copper amine oxidase N-terminal domain-containing protein [Brevibacillus sp.]|nr:copper amine oxidase N-terminal domain-containing protein [Brevibacillus sp.]
MKKTKKGLSIVLAATVVTSPFVAPPQAYAIKNLKVSADDTETGEESEYTIEFKLEDSLDRGEKIYIKFDRDFEIDDSIGRRDVEVNGETARDVEVDGNVIEIEVPEDLEDGDTVEVVIEDGITNPDDEDDYEISVKTDNESWEDAEIEIGDDDGFRVKIGDNKAGVETSYTLGSFDLDGSDTLEESEWITVIFPDEDMLPRSIDEEDVEINGEEADDVEVDDDEVRIKIPEDVDGDDELEIEFSEDAGLTNPDAGDYTIKVKYNGVTYKSEEFEIKSSSSGSVSKDFTVNLSDRTVGSRSSYSFEVNLGSKKLSYNNEIQVQFPSAEMVPSYIAPTSVSINGSKASSVWVYGNVVYLSTPFSFKPDSKVKVEFSQDANIINPKLAGEYDLTVKLAGETIRSKKFSIVGTLITIPNGTIDNSTATITLSKTALNSPTAITVGIKGVTVPLTRNQDFLELAFPAGFTVPATFTASSVTVNGLAAGFVTSRGQNLVIYPSQDLYANAAINVVISEAAGIKTPPTAQAYNIGVYTSKERAPLFIRAVGVGGVNVPPPVPADAARLKLNVASFTKNGQTHALPVAPYTANGNTLVPAQFFRDALGLTTQWNGSTAVIISGSTVIRFTVGSDKAQIGQTTVKLPVAVQVKNNMPMLPIRFVSDTLKYTIGWDGATSSIVMYK